MKIKTIALSEIKTKEITLFFGLLFVASIVPLIGSQAVTGPVVNATLFLATVFIGIQGAVGIALFPSIVALSTGMLPAATFPLVPFIMTGNVILVLVFKYFSQNFWKGVIFASFAKFLFLYAASFLVLNNLLEGAVLGQVSVMMSWPQLLTALTGGVIAFGAKSFFKI